MPSERLGLYIHIPLCKKKCHYCDFYSLEKSEHLAYEYVEALRNEALKYTGFKPSTVFVGGGTPSILTATEINRLFEYIYSVFNKDSFKELTFEANPESLSREKIYALKKCGVNRLSFGVQSFFDSELRFLGRIHRTEDLMSAFHSARELGFRNLSADLIFGIPEQTIEQWKLNLSKAVQLGFEHISLYPLTVEPDTYFQVSGVFVDDAVQSDMYEWSMDYLQENGYSQYEISNWAKPGFECSHNINYWENGSYIGLGAAAASHMNGVRKKNISDINKYIKGCEAAQEIDNISQESKLGEDIMLKLRCSKGLLLTEEISNAYAAPISRFLNEGLLYSFDNRIALTRKGMQFANVVFREFIV